MLAYNSSIQRAGGTWVRQPAEEISLLVALADDTVRDLYLCAVLKFLRDLLLTTPSDQAMTEMLGILEQMCQKEEVLEIGATEEDESQETERQEIYSDHSAEQAALVAATVLLRLRLRLQLALLPLRLLLRLLLLLRTPAGRAPLLLPPLTSSLTSLPTSRRWGAASCHTPLCGCGCCYGSSSNKVLKVKVRPVLHSFMLLAAGAEQQSTAALRPKDQPPDGHQHKMKSWFTAWTKTRPPSPSSRAY